MSNKEPRQVELIRQKFDLENYEQYMRPEVKEDWRHADYYAFCYYRLAGENKEKAFQKAFPLAPYDNPMIVLYVQRYSTRDDVRKAMNDYLASINAAYTRDGLKYELVKIIQDKEEKGPTKIRAVEVYAKLDNLFQPEVVVTNNNTMIEVVMDEFRERKQIKFNEDEDDEDIIEVDFENAGSE